VLATALLLVISISASFAQTAGDYKSVGSGDWDAAGTWARYNGSTWITSPPEGWPGQNAGTGTITIQSLNNVTIAGNLTTNPVGTVKINGDLSYTGDWIFILNTSNLTITPDLNPVAKIILENKSELKLPPGATIYAKTGGFTGKCSNNTQVFIGSDFFSCNGGGGSSGNFDDLYTPTLLSLIPAARCGTGTVNLVATSSIGSTISWFATYTGGASLATGTSFTTPIISTTTTYYAEAKNTITGFVSDPRTAVLATIDTNPTLALTSGAGTDAQTTCINTAITPITYSTTGVTGATFSGLPTGVNGSWAADKITISGTPTVSGAALTYTITLTGGCGSGTSTGTITVTPAVEKPVFTSVGATSSRIQGVASGTYTATETNNLPISYSISPLTAGTIDAVGKVTYNALWSGTCTITASATKCGETKTADHTVYTTWCFALFTGDGALSCAGASFIRGDVGTHIGAVTGFDTPGTLDGQVHKGADPIAVQGAIDVNNAYNALTLTPCGPGLGTPLGNGTVLTPNVYCLGAALILNGNLTLDGLGDPNAKFIFKIGGALTSNTGFKIILINGASPFNVYWLVSEAVVLGPNSDFSGTIVAHDAISLNTGASLSGRAISTNGAIAITINVITSNCSPYICETDNIAPTFLTDPPSKPFCVENIQQATYDPTDINIIPADRPDYYTLKAHDTDLDLASAVYFADNCTPPKNLFLHWRITNSLNQPIQDVNGLILDDMVGQVSSYTNAADIIFPGAANADVTYTITYWLKDLNGNTSTTKTASITIKPRPEFL